LSARLRVRRLAADLEIERKQMNRHDRLACVRSVVDE
jgi:hypothetical protein